MSDRPTFVRPPLGRFLVLDGGIAALTVLAASDTAYEAAADAVPLPSRRTVRRLLHVTAALHVGEALYVRRLVRRHGLPSGPWVRQTLAVGFPSTLAARRLVRSA